MSSTVPLRLILHCPMCRTRHIDYGEWETRPHRKHLCEVCGCIWRPALVPTVGVAELTPAPIGLGGPARSGSSLRDVLATMSPEEKSKLRPIAEVLAMQDGNAFFGNVIPGEGEWYEQYLPEARSLYEANGGDSGWAGQASFAAPCRVTPANPEST